jgi:hypothetical protein
LSADINVVDTKSPPQNFDFQTFMMSLPMWLQTRFDDIPSWPSYLAADPERVERWRTRLGDSKGPKVGIAWQPNMKGFDKRHELPLQSFQALSRIPGVRLISLQVNDGVEQLKHLPPGMNVEAFDDLDAGPDAFVDTAALMENLDLVVTCDTSIGHLAGALGRPTWVALKKQANWRWFVDRADSPWYPTVKLYRQQQADVWDDVFERMAADLVNLQ